MKEKDFYKLIESVQANIIITDYNSHSYVCKILLNDYLDAFKQDRQNGKNAAYYFNEIKRLLREFNLSLNLNYEDII